MGDYYTPTTFPVNGGDGKSIDLRAELQAIGAGFSKLGPLAGNPNKLLVVNAAGNAQTVMPGQYAVGVSWLPVLTCVTPGDLVVAYAFQLGEILQIGQFIRYKFYIQTSTFTHTTSAGSVFLSGIPVATTGGQPSYGTMSYQGITKAGYTTFIPTMPAVAGQILFEASGSAQAKATLAITDLPTGGTVILTGEIWGMLGS